MKLVAHVIVLLLFAGTGCYNNTFVQTQKLLEEDEYVWAMNAGMSMIGKFDYDISYTGMPGMLAGVSYLQGRPGGEYGLSITAGVGDEAIVYTPGLSIAKYGQNQSGTPFKLGLHVELNVTAADAYPKGQVWLLRPSLTTTTSRDQRSYFGVHGLWSSGSLESGNLETTKPYSTSGIGIGLTMGREVINYNSKWSYQMQLDLSWVVYTYDSNDNDGQRNQQLPILGLSVSSNHFRKKRSQATTRAHPLPTVIQPPPQPQKPKKVRPEEVRPTEVRPKEGQRIIDPETGEFITKPSDRLQIDPETGLPVEKADSAAQTRFDPNTGLMVPVEVPEEPVTILDPETGLPVEAPVVDTPKPVRFKQPQAARISGEAKSKLKTRALTDARRHHDGFAWGLFGAGATAAGVLGGGILGAAMLEFPGFLIGTVVGGGATYAIITSTVPRVPIPPDVQMAGQEQRSQYEKHYASELVRLRRQSIKRGLLTGVLVGLIVISM
ncbi:MAG: hypothetical protein KAU50_06120 [Candidatus Marinimicrobia bacterium]|nr:hypothetical protein [Candidatus Neomarinimicrobiota bacterium]